MSNIRLFIYFCLCQVFQFLNAKCESAFLAKRNPRQINWTVLYRRKHKKGQSVSTILYMSSSFIFVYKETEVKMQLLFFHGRQTLWVQQLILAICETDKLILAIRYKSRSSHLLKLQFIHQTGCGWMVCTVLVRVTCCCSTVFCRLSSSAHSTPAATEYLEIIVLAFDVFADIFSSVSLQTLQHADSCYLWMDCVQSC